MSCAPHRRFAPTKSGKGLRQAHCTMYCPGKRIHPGTLLTCYDRNGHKNPGCGQTMLGFHNNAHQPSQVLALSRSSILLHNPFPYKKDQPFQSPLFQDVSF